MQNEAANLFVIYKTVYENIVLDKILKLHTVGWREISYSPYLKKNNISPTTSSGLISDGRFQDSSSSFFVSYTVHVGVNIEEYTSTIHHTEAD